MRRRFLAGVFAATLGWAGLRASPNAAAPVPAVNWPAFLARQDMVWPAYSTRWENSPFIGNGDLGAFIHREPSDGPLLLEVNRTDVTHGGLRYAMGHLAIQVAGGFDNAGEIRLDLWNAEARGAMKNARGTVQWRAFVAGSPSVIVLDLTGLRAESGTQVIWLPTLARPPRIEKRTDGFPPEDLHPPPQVETVIDGVNSTQTFLGGGAYAVVLRRIFSSLNRKVYVVSIDVGDTAKRALSEAQLSAERAASLGIDGLLAAHRSWWHQYYPASFVALPDPRLEAFYWIQIYKLGSLLRAGGPLPDLMGPWFRANPPPIVPVTGLNRDTRMAYAPIFSANRLSLGDSLFSADLKSYPPDQDLSVVAELAWEDYRYGMDEGTLNNRVVPLLVRAIATAKADPAFQRWALQILIRIGDRPKAPDARLAQWKAKLAALPPTPPRSLVHLRPDRPNERKIIEATIRSREGRTNPSSGQAPGSAVSPTARARGLGEAASLRALLGQGDAALADLNLFLSNRSLRPNTLFADGTPVVGAPLAAAAAIQDLLLQSWGNKLRPFPAMPTAWKDASFATLRGEGGFLVSGVYQNGATAWIKVEASNGMPCRILVPGWTQAVVRSARQPDLVVNPGEFPGEFGFTLGKGGWVVLAPSAEAPLPPVGSVVRPDTNPGYFYPLPPAPPK